MSAGRGLGCKLTSAVHVRLQGDPQRTQGQRVKGPWSQGLPGPQGWDCHGPWPDHRHVQPGEGCWAGKGSAGLLGWRTAGQQREGGPCWAPGTLGGGPCLGDEWGLFLPHPGPPQVPQAFPPPHPPRKVPPTLLLPGTVGSNRVQKSGLDKGFLQEVGLRTPHLECSHTTAVGRRARPQAGPIGPSGPRIQGNQGSKAAPSEGHTRPGRCRPAGNL